MARPKPTVLLEHTDSKTYKSEQVLAADYIYAVYKLTGGEIVTESDE